ncbi:actin-related protein ARPC5 [Ceraceosorus guamensis]|uniref:Actin-related protein 2/3 complex subunit 5 n=1 Tax=Ceraceosorus guamensis TaxID=1522189 RepID=A0A316W790_9BASI|nr:actin-related protein ARPC5 [Ceraceosorus guamensis]PWN45790.1 actin-related protein ARPC5 [Ceraceosorus guamensis]
MSDFRKINVDIYDDEALNDEDLYDADIRTAADVLSLARSKAGEVRGLVGRGDAAGALAVVLAEPPYSPDAEEAKSLTLATILEVFNSTKSSDIASVVKALNVDQQDTLMKFIYKGLGKPELGASAVLLNWHDKLTEVAGTGSIVRVMTDHRRV